MRVRALVLAPFLERPAAERQRRKRRHAAPGKRRRTIAEYRAFRAFMLARDLLAEPCTEQLPNHRATPFQNADGSAPGGWRMFPIDPWDFAPTVGWDFSLLGTLNRDFWPFSAIGTLLD
jgi:hypothetical protein